MSKVQIRLTARATKPLLDHLEQRGHPEPMAFGFARHAKTQGGELVLVDEIVIPPASALLPAESHGARWKGSYTIQLLNEATARESGLFIFHSHAGGNVRMSPDDTTSSRELLPKFQLIIPARPHGSIVLGADSAAGLVLMPGRVALSEELTFRLFDRKMVTYPLPEDNARERLRFLRQPLAVGSRASRILARSTVAVVGQSGGGTHVTQQLAQLGIGRILGIDDDHIEDGNRRAAVLFSEADAKSRTRKVDAAGKYVAQTSPSVAYLPVASRLPQLDALEALKQADIIVGCVNNLHARADIQELAHRYAIPYIDIGLTIETEQDNDEEFPQIRAISGNIFTFVPGGPCLWCIGFLTEEKLERETEFRGRPYLRTASKADAMVVSFNGVLASQAVNEVLALLTGFSSGECHHPTRNMTGEQPPLHPGGLEETDAARSAHRSPISAIPSGTEAKTYHRQIPRSARLKPAANSQKNQNRFRLRSGSISAGPLGSGAQGSGRPSMAARGFSMHSARATSSPRNSVTRA